MSIYATWLVFESGALDEVARMDALIGDMERARPAFDDDAPWMYRGSHIRPSRDDPRGGHFSVSAIPDHITVDAARRDWLRVIASDESATVGVLLDRAQATKLRDMLTAWLQREPER